MYAGAHEDTDTQTLTVTKITTVSTSFTNRQQGLQPTSQRPGIWKICLAGVENCCFDIKKNLSYVFVIQML